MSSLFKIFLQFILGLFKSSKAEIQEPEPILYFDHYITFNNAPLIGKVFHRGKNMFRVVGYRNFRGRFKCQLEVV